MKQAQDEPKKDKTNASKDARALSPKGQTARITSKQLMEKENQNTVPKQPLNSSRKLSSTKVVNKNKNESSVSIDTRRQ